jgi:hypothetical protein
MGNVNRRVLGVALVVACNLLVGGLGAAGASATSSPGTLSKTAYLSAPNGCSTAEGGATMKVKGTLSATITLESNGQWQASVSFTSPIPKLGQSAWYVSGAMNRTRTYASPRTTYFFNVPGQFSYMDSGIGGSTNNVRFRAVVKVTTAGFPTSVTTKLLSSGCG